MEAVVNNAKNTMKISLSVIVVAFGICRFRYISEIVICNKFFHVNVQQKYNELHFLYGIKHRNLSVSSPIFSKLWGTFGGIKTT